MAEIITLAQEAMRTKGVQDAQALAARAVAGEADGTVLIDQEEKIPTWRQRDFSDVSVGTPYKWQGQVYKLWQQHNATGQGDWSPDKVVSLWDICHTTDPARAKPYAAPQGARGLYQKGECCIWESQVWRSTADNNAYSPADYPGSWEAVSNLDTGEEA